MTKCYTYRMSALYTCTVCTGQAWHGRGTFLGKDGSCDNTLAIYTNYLSMTQKS